MYELSIETSSLSMIRFELSLIQVYSCKSVLHVSRL